MTQPQPGSGSDDAIPEGWTPAAAPPPEPTSMTPPPPYPDPSGTQQYSAPGCAPPPQPGGPGPAPYPPGPYPANPYPPYAGGPYGSPAPPYPYGASPYQPYPQPTPPPSRAAAVIRWLITASAVLVGICAFLPWATASVLGAEISVHGTDDGKDGWITLTMAVIAGIIAVISADTRRSGGVHLAAGIVATVMGALITIVAIADTADLNDRSNDITGYGGHIDTGIGLIGTMVFGIAMLGLGIAAIVKRR